MPSNTDGLRRKVYGNVAAATRSDGSSLGNQSIDEATDSIMQLLDQELARREGEAQNQVIEWLEADLERLDSRNWTMDTLTLDMLVGNGNANDHQKSKRQQIVEDRRAAHALYAILNDYKKFKATIGKERA